MSQAIPFAVAVGQKARARRQELGLSQDAVAGRLWPIGFTRGVVDAIERGTRQLELPELLALLAALDLTLGDLRSAGQIALAGDLSVSADTLIDQGLGGRRTWEVTRGATTARVNPSNGVATAYADLRRIVGHYSDAETKAARKLGVEPAAIRLAADKLWQRPLERERDLRVQAQAPEDAPLRTLQAIRGHVTRALLKELEPALAKEQDKGRRKR